MSFPSDWSYRRKINITVPSCIDDESLTNSFVIDGDGYIATGIDIGTEIWTDRSYYIPKISDCLKQKCFFKGPFHQSSVTLTYNGENFVDVYVSRDGRDSIDNLTSQGFVLISSLVCDSSIGESGTNPRKILYKKISQGDSFTLYDVAEHGTDFAIFSCDCKEREPLVGYQILLKIGESSGSSDFDFHLDNRSAKFPSQQDDGGDLRFTLDDGTTLLPFWVEKVEGTAPNRTAYVWVKVNADLSTDQNIYIYFGNANADNVSNAVNTFIRVIDGVVGSWHFDEGGGITAHDTSGNGNDGTLVNGPAWIDGKFGKALSFDGTDDYIDCGNDESLDITGEITLEAWAKQVGGDGGYIVVKNTADDSKRLYSIYSEGEADIIAFYYYDGATKRVTWDYALDDNTWHHVVITVNGLSATLYVDGINQGNKTLSGAFQGDATAKVKIGKREPDTLHFRGSIDEVRIYNRALSQEEILDLYNNYGYTTINYPRKTLVRKYIYLEPAFSSVDTIEPSYTLQGTVCDKNGNPITGTSVKIFLLDKDTGELLQTTTSNSEDGSWSADLWSTSPKTLAVFALEGTYGEDTDIAGAEFLEVE